MKRAAIVSGVLFLFVVSLSYGAVFELDFNSDPEALGVEFFGTSEWRDEGGVDNSGYLSVTDNSNSQIGAIVFPDFEEGQVVNAFSITAQLRVGGGTAPPADGFSFNFVRPDDRLLDEEDEPLAIDTLDGRGNGWAEIPPHPNLYLPEEGSQTGLGIMFDTYQNGPAAPSGDCDEINRGTGEPYDCIGIGVRIDNEVVTATSLPVINGAFDDTESLTTNVDDEFADTGVAPGFDLDLLHDGEGLTWASLEIEYSQSGNLRVAYKGREIMNEAVEYEPSAGRLVFGGRTGGANAFHHIDNITLRTNADVGGGNASQLQAGDANMDLSFDQLDLVKVQIAAKYLTGQAATWGDGDWNGAPGGSQGNPPTGDGLFNQVDIIAALNAGKYLTGPYGAIQKGGDRGDGQTSIVYYEATGEVSVNAPAGKELTSVNIESASGIFTGAPAQNLGGSFDNDSDYEHLQGHVRQ